MIKKPQGKQHHGNLKEALVLAGLEILEEDGLEGLTLRKCAARAGVSHAAPKHHFDNVGALKSAIAARAYKVFETSMREGIAEAGDDPLERVRGISNGYIRFATEHNALFNLIFVPHGTYPPDPERDAASDSARRVLAEISQAVATPRHGLSVTEVAIWSMAHGYAKLIEIGRVLPGSGDGRDISFDDVFPFLTFAADQGDPSSDAN